MAEPLFDQLQSLQSSFKGHPPVSEWDPDLCGDMDLRVMSNGRWVHEGQEIAREALVKLFASILKRENGDYFLVTPVEKWRIQVEDVPFLVTQAARASTDDTILLTTNTGDVLELGQGTQWVLKAFGSPERTVPYIEVRDGLQARVSRDVYYQLVDWAVDQLVENDHPAELMLVSGGSRFPLGPLS